MKRLVCWLLAAWLIAFPALAQENYTVSQEDSLPDAESRYAMQAAYLIAGMTLREKVCQLFITVPEALADETVTEVSDAFREAYARTPVGGFVFYARNLVSPEQTKSLLHDIDEAAREIVALPPFFSVDEEGGSVQRVSYRLGTEKIPSARAVGLTGDAENAYEIGKTLARDLSALGFTVNFAPVADVSGGADAYIGARSYGESPELVAALSTAVARGLQDNGVIAVMKHFPGHGSLVANVHKARASDTRALDDFRASDFIPFKAGVDMDIGMVMMSDLVMRALSDAPACLSPQVVTGLLREELHYNGVIVTDALRMDAITESFSSGEAAVLAIEAGCDMILLPNDLESAVNAVIKAVESGRMTETRIENSLTRIMRLKLKYKIY